MKIIGLVGKSLRHSFSKLYFEQIFKTENLNHYEYRLFELQSIEEFPIIIEKIPNLIGVNVTIPYKQQILKFVNYLTPEVEKIEACNVITISKDKKLITAYNTDVYGFEHSLREFIDTTVRNALILGNGGASKAAQFVLDKLSISYIVAARQKKSPNDLLLKDINKSIVENVDLVVNTTPVGQYPDIDQIIDFPFEFISSKHYCYDMIYNPTETKFLQFAKKQGAKIKNGYQMLLLQADKSWDIFKSVY